MAPSSALARAALLAAAVVAPLAASEWADDEDDLIGSVDIRLGLGTTSGGYRVQNFDAGTQSERRFGDSERATLTWVGTIGLSPSGGWLWGLGFSIERFWHGDIGDGRDLGVEAGAFTLHAGYGWAVAHGWRLELLPSVGFGRLSIRHPTPTATDAYLEWGLDANLVRTTRSGVQVGVAIGALGYDSDIDEGEPSLRYNLHANAILSGGLFVGYRIE